MSDKLRKPRQGETEVWLRYKTIYERHQAGETYSSIARELNVSVGRVKEMSDRWKFKLEGYEEYKSMPDFYMSFNRGREAAAKYERLVNAGLLGNGVRSPEYGYA